MVYYKKFDSGLRLILKKIDGLFSVTMGVIVGTGSSFETDKENGISHFIEHMLFKGTKTRSAFDISDGFDKLGAQVNAFTSKDITCYYSKSTSEHTEKCFESLADLVLNSVFDKEEMAREKGVVLEEISMTEDTPDDLCFDLLSEAYFGKNGYGKTILGPSDNVSNFTKQDILDYMDERYSPDNIVISIAGNVDFKQAEDLVYKYFESKVKAKPTKKRNKIIELKHNSLIKTKDIEQVHIALGYKSVERQSKFLNATTILNMVLGGSMSSRLFQEVREKQGLAYSVYSYPSTYVEQGVLVIYAGVNPKNVQKAYSSITGIIEDIKNNGIYDDEFKRGKEQIKAAAILGQESTASQMLLYGKELIYTGEILDFDKRLDELYNVNMDDINEAIKVNFDEKYLAVSAVGKIKKEIEL